MKKLLLAVLAFVLMGCSTVQKSEDWVVANPKIIASIGTELMRILVKTDSDRISISNDMYAVAALIRSCEDESAISSPEQFDSSIASAISKGRTRYSEVLQLIGAVYQLEFPRFNGDVKLALNTIESLAQAAEVCAKNILNK